MPEALVSNGDEHPQQAQLIDAREEVAGLLSRFRIGTAGRLALFHALVIATVLGIVVLQFTQAFASRYQSTITSDLSENVSAFSHGAAVRPVTQSLEAFSRSFLASHGEVAGDIIIITIPSSHLALGTVGSGALAAVPRVATLLRHPPRSTVLSQVTLNRSPQEVLAAPVIEGKTVGVPHSRQPRRIRKRQGSGTAVGNR